MNHPDSEQLLRYAEGEALDPDVEAHVRECAACSTLLRELGEFEADVAGARPMAPELRDRLRHAASQQLRRAARPAIRVSWFALAVGAAAAALLSVLLWPDPPAACSVEIARYLPTQATRSERIERFQLQVALAAPRWLCIWQLGPGGEVTMLLPNPDPLLGYLGTPMPLPVGSHRVPASDVLDFEFPAASPPREILIVPTAVELTAAQRGEIERQLRSTPHMGLESQLRQRFTEARIVSFPQSR